MSLSLYGYWRSSATYRVRIALNLKGLDFEYTPIHLLKEGGQQRKGDYKHLNPSMLVPSLIDINTGVSLTQSLAIIEYIDEQYPTKTQLVPGSIKERAFVRMLSQDLACDVQPLANLRVLQALKLKLGVQDKGTKEWANHWITEGLVAFEARAKTCSGVYAYKDSVTMIDACLVPQVYSAMRFGVDMNKFPITKQIYERCNTIAAFIDAAPENQIDAE